MDRSTREVLYGELAELREEMNVDRVPITFVALDDHDGLIGTAALIFDDLEGDPRNPWLASVFVPPAHRKKGIASALVRTVEEAARRLGLTPAAVGKNVARLESSLGVRLLLRSTRRLTLTEALAALPELRDVSNDLEVGAAVTRLTIDREAGDYLPYMFGANGYTLIRQPQQLPLRLPQLYRQLTQS